MIAPGLIDKDFASYNNIQPRAFQFRLGIKPQPYCPVMRIAKGTLAPARLDKLGESSFRMEGNVKDGTMRSKFGYDMILATSSFKGRKGNDAIKPGEYTLSFGLSVKSLALYREHSLGTQILVNYPQTVREEILPIIKQQAEKLAIEQKDLLKLAQRYIESYERRKVLLIKGSEFCCNSKENVEQFSIFDILDSGGDNLENQDAVEHFPTKKKGLITILIIKSRFIKL